MSTPMPISRFHDLLIGNRIALQRWVALAVLAFALLAEPPELSGLWWADVSEVIGFLMLGLATFGRLWCLMFIGGLKNSDLVTDGPYSVVRNPLYLFSFVGAVGVGLAIEQPFIALVLGTVFAVYYRSVVRREEHTLRARFGERYFAYQNKTPRWIPRCSQYRESAQITVAPRWMRKGMLDAMWFLLAFLAWELIEDLHKFGLLPVLF